MSPRAMSSEKIEQIHDEEVRGSAVVEAIESKKKPRLAPQTILAIVVSCCNEQLRMTSADTDSPYAFCITPTSSRN